MLHHDRSLHTEIFGRSNVVGKACNASSGGLFCNVIVVPDSYYFDCQHELYDALLHCSPSDVESLSIILHNYMRQTMHVPYRQYTMSIVPYIMSLS